MQSCSFCGHPASLIHVHGHYQCSVCGTNALPCCDGDNCDTNLLLASIAEAKKTDIEAGEAQQKATA